jgi:hypothetical protein
LEKPGLALRLDWWRSRPLVVCGLLGAAVVGIAFYAEGSIGYNLWDEGFLWYGAQRVQLGEVPLRDFMAYDIARYYWSAGIMGLLGSSSLLALRFTEFAFQWIGITVGLWLLARRPKSIHPIELLLAAVVLKVWMFPWYKSFDITASILLIAALARLLETPTRRQYFITGVVVGLAAILGRNHGVYGAVGSALAIGGMALRQRQPAPLIQSWAWAAGVAVGYLPMLVVIAAIPGLPAAFWDSLVAHFQMGSTNLSLPIPWPWRVHLQGVPLRESLSEILLGLGFIALPLFGAVGTLQFFRGRGPLPGSKALVMAAAVLAAAYSHYAFSRADIAHLGLGIFPLLVGIFAALQFLPRRWRGLVAVGAAIASLILMLPVSASWKCYRWRDCVDVTVQGEHLLMEPWAASDFRVVQGLVDQYAGDGRTFLVVPFWPGAYPGFGRKCPTWEIYPLVHRSADFQLAEVERIKAARPGFVLIYDYPLDGREELRFRNTHPLEEQYIRAHFDRVENATANPAFQVYVDGKVAR